MKVFSLLPTMLVALLSSCGGTLDEPAGRSAEAAPPGAGKADGTDAADRSCQIILRDVRRPYDGEGQFQTTCEESGCRYFWLGSVEVATSLVASGGSPSVIYHLASDPSWWEVPASPAGPGAPGYSRFEFRLDEHLFGPEVPPEELGSYDVELIPVLRMPDGSRLFDHNIVTGDLDAYRMTASGYHAIGEDGYVCRHRPRTAAIEFREGWEEAVIGSLQAGGTLAVHYDLDRLPDCRNTHNGYPAWDTTAFVKVLPGGEILSGSVRAFVSDRGRPTSSAYTMPFEAALPADAEAVEIWFRNASGAGSTCETWDSDFGANYRFELQPPPEEDPCFGVARWEDRYRTSPACIDYAPALEADATHCELYLNALGDGYEGHYGIPFNWLEAYVSTGAQDGEILNVGMVVEYFDRSDATEGARFMLGREIEPAYWLIGFSYVHTGYMGDGSYRYTVERFAFFVDVRRPGGEVVRLWQSRGGADYTWDDAFSLPTTPLYIPYGRVEYANEASIIFDARRTCR